MTPRTVAHQALLSMGFSRQEYWSGLPFPSKNIQTTSQLQTNSYASKIMFKIFQVKLQYYVNQELPEVQGGFRKGRETREQIANIRWIIEKARDLQKNISVQFSCSVISDCAIPWTAACQTSLSITNSWSLFKLMSIKLMSHPTISSSVIPFQPSTFPSIWVFSNESVLHIR